MTESITTETYTETTVKFCLDFPEISNNLKYCLYIGLPITVSLLSWELIANRYNCDIKPSKFKRLLGFD